MIKRAARLTKSLADWCTDWFRTVKYNHLKGASFTTKRRLGHWKITTWDGVEICFATNPFLAFYEISNGYLGGKGWKIKEGMTVVDAGACCGEFTIYAAFRVGDTGRVVVLEPDPVNQEAIKRNFELSGGMPNNVTFVDAGLWTCRDTLTFGSGAGASSSLVETKATHADSTTKIDVAVLCLADLVKELGLKRLDLIKMDIEGAEIEAIEKQGAVLQKYQPRIAIASYHIRDGAKTALSLEKIMKSFGMQVETVFPLHLTTRGWF